MTQMNPFDSTITLERWCYGPLGTFSMLMMPDGWECVTVEPPWRGNRVSESCIPEGVYRMQKRRSYVVERTTGGDHIHGWEIQNVPERTYIMLHPGNVARDTEGCVCPGSSVDVIYDTWAVANSRNTFDELMERMDVKSQWWMDVRHYVVEYP